MRRRRLRRRMIASILSMAVVVGWIFVCEAQQKKAYINGIDPGYPPFAYVDKKGAPSGFDVECVNWIAQQMGFEVKHQPTAWDGIIPALKAKKIDFIASGMTITKERSAQVDFTQSYWVVRVYVIAREDSKLDVNTAMSAGHSIGAQRGTNENRWVEEKVKQGMKVNLKLYDTPFLVIEDLINGRLDAAVMGDPPIKEALKSKRPIKMIGPLGMDDQVWAYAVRKGDKELLDALNEGLTRLKKSEKWNELIVKFDIK